MDQLPTKQYTGVRLLLRTPTRDWRRVEGLLVLTHWHVHFYPTAIKDGALDLQASYTALSSVERRREPDLELDMRVWVLQLASEAVALDLSGALVRYASARASLLDSVPAFSQSLPFDLISGSLNDGWTLAKDAYPLDCARVLARAPASVQAQWTLSRVNSSYELCASYPRGLYLPTRLANDARLLKSAAEHRDHQRLPVLSWVSSKGAALLRSAQPMSGLGNRRSDGDEALLRAAFEAHGRAVDTARILDARPYTNAVANRAIKGGYEDAAAYFGIHAEFLGMENIHALRDALRALQRSLRADEPSAAAAASAPWLLHVSQLLRGGNRIARLVHVEQRAVLVHCSHGWDRTAQLTSLAQLLLDAHYRTLSGLALLVEKEWCALGHQCSLRAGHVASRASLSGAQHVDASEASPVLVLWADALWQLQRQHPTAFEYNERALLAIVDEYYAAHAGTFLGDCEAEREAMRVRERTPSLWSWLLEPTRRAAYLNPLYEPAAPEAPPLEGAWSPDKLALWEALHLRQDYMLHKPPSLALLDAVTKRLQQTEQRLKEKERELTKEREKESEKESEREKEKESEKEKEKEVAAPK